MSTNKKIYTDSIARYINSSGKSQKEIADELNISQSTISGIVNGERDPKLSTVIGLADLFGVSIDTLTGYTPGSHAKTQEEIRLENELERLDNNVRACAKWKEEWTASDMAEYVSQEIFLILHRHELL